MGNKKLILDFLEIWKRVVTLMNFKVKYIYILWFGDFLAI